MIKVFTDGSFDQKSGLGTYAVYSEDLDLILKGHEDNSSQNRMELKAVIQAMDYLKHNGHKDSEVVLFTDSKYVYNCIADKKFDDWIRVDFHKRANKDLWMHFILLSYSLPNVRVEWEKGKSNRYNRIVDSIANKLLKLIIKSK